MFDRDYFTFLRAAARRVEERTAEVEERLKTGKLGEGKWHPTGFATFEISRIEELGVMRMHVWPVGFRRGLVGHPKIHRHSFQLYSKILAGTYIESLYEINTRDGSSEGRVRGYSRMREFAVDTTVRDGVDRLVATRKWVNVRPVACKLTFGQGSWHDVPAGQFHSTSIPRTEFCITLAVLSVPVAGGADVLLGSSRFKVLTHRRMSVTEDDADSICHQYADCLPAHASSR